MILERPGTDISISEVTSVGPHGLWLLIDAEEHFVAFVDYPQFRQASVEQIFRLQRIGTDQLHWPELDIDIEVDALRHPENYSLIWQE